MTIGYLSSIIHACIAGTSKIVVQHIEIRDATGSLDSTPGTPPSAILVPWNPDESWKRDALLRVNAVLGAPTRTHTVYEHVDVMVHPLGVNLVESIASSFWVWFFLQAYSQRGRRSTSCIIVGIFKTVKYNLDFMLFRAMPYMYLCNCQNLICKYIVYRRVLATDLLESMILLRNLSLV